MARRVSSPAFVGRADELAALIAALTAAQERQATALFVAGESGVGKSRLVAEFERRALEAGARVLTGACVDLGDAELPYAPIVAALRALAREVDADELERLAGPDRDELARLLPELGPPRAALGSADALAQVRLFEALLGLLARLGRAAPVVLVVDDLQWADPSTRAFLNFLVRNARREALLLVATYRNDDLHRRHPLRPFLADIERAPGFERLELAPFTRQELAAQLEAILDGAPERRLVDDLFERSQGNAFFAEELLAASRAGGAAVPATIRDALTLRVERLSEPTQRTLRLAAVAGASVGDPLLTAASDLGPEELGAALREALEHNVVVRDAAAEGQLGAAEEMVRAYMNLGQLLDESGRLEESTDLVLEGWRRMRSTLPSQAAILASEAASRLTRLGRWDEALEVVEATEVRPTNFFGGTVLVVLARLETARGDLELADDHLEQVRRSFLAGSPGGMWRQTEREVAGALALARGRPEEARAAVADVLGAGVPVASAGHFAGPVYAVGVRAEAELAARARALGDEVAERDAIARAGQLAEQARHIVGPDHFPLGPPPADMLANAELAELELSRAQGAADPDAWGEHAARLEELGRPFMAAYARFREGEAAVEQGLPRARAAAPLKAARATAVRLGARPLLRDVDELARRARVDLGVAAPDPSATTAERLGLTPRELEVLRLVADGRTNVEIGGELYMSRKTASVHVSHILAKLGVRTRLEAATTAHRLGLVDTETADA